MSAIYTNGVLDLRRSESLPLIKFNIIVGDTFTRVIGLKELAVDFSACSAVISFLNHRPPEGEVVYSNESMSFFNVVLPANDEEYGSGDFTINVPSHTTSAFAQYSTLYGSCRLLKPSGSISTVFTFEASMVYV
jgi:hypothetical protein